MKLIFLVLATISASAQDTLVVQFDYDQHLISSANKEALDSMLKTNKEVQNATSITIIGHTDTDGDAGYNLELGKRRALTVKKILLKHLSANNITIESRGENEPTVIDTGEVNKALNRRVEIIFNYDTEQLLTKDQLKIGNKIVLQNLNFYGGEALVVPESKPVLLQLLKTMIDHPTLEIRLEGHVCCSPPGEDGYDFSTGLFNLSEARAKAVYQFLIDNGVSRSRLSYKGLKGDFRLVQIERTEDDKLKNRRVEMVITHY